MSEIEGLGAIIGALKSALLPDCAAIATHLGVRREFIYALRDDRPELPRNENRGLVATAAEDPRYIKVDEFCKAQGITGFMDAVDAALHATKELVPVFTRAGIYGPKQAFQRVLTETGAMNDPQVAELWVNLIVRLDELAT